MDAIAALALQLEWGADEALEEMPVDRLRPVSPPAPVAPAVAPPVGRVPARVAAVVPSSGVEPVEAGDFAGLCAAIAAFAGCALKDTAGKTLLPAGDPGSGLLIIGDPPGDAEDRSGQAFSGPVGDYMDRVLPPLGLSRAGVLAAHLIPWRPPGNRTPTDAEVAQCLPFLHRLIVLTRPRQVVLLGALAVRALLPNGQSQTLRRLRGRWVEMPVPGLAEPVPALAMHGPTAFRSAADRRDAWADWRMLRRNISDLGKKLSEESLSSR